MLNGRNFIRTLKSASVIFFITFLAVLDLAAGRTIVLKDGCFYVDGKPFFIRAIGYAPWRPGQWPDPPTEQVDPDIIEADFKRIKQAGFNTIRSWGSLNARELKLAEKYDLMVIQGIWLNPNINYGDPLVQKSLLKQLKWELKISRGAPHILMYLVLTEPKPGAVLLGGIPRTEDFFRTVKQTVQEVDPRPVSMDSWLPIAFLDHSMWDVVTFNTFAFAPACVTYALGFKGYNEWLRIRVAKDKPYFVGETGGYAVSPSTFGAKGGGAGGFTEEEQSRLNLVSLKDVEDAGAIGWTLVAWNDTWHYPEDPHTQDPQEPWEWDGVIGFASKTDRIGTPRKIFYDLPAFNRNTATKYHRLIRFSSNAPSIKIEFKVVLPATKSAGGPSLAISLLDSAGKPMPHQNIRVGYFIPEPWQEASGTAVTDDQGQVVVMSPIRTMQPEQVLIVAAGLVDNDGKHIGGDIIFLNSQNQVMKMP